TATLADNAELQLALGYSLVRAGRASEALDHFEIAATRAADTPDFAYVHGIALNSLGRAERALEVLSSAHERFPGHRDLLYALTTVLRDEGLRDEALLHARRLAALAPADERARALVEELSAGQPD
ncbi:MAG: hypothetical protein R3315_07380, partial [Woeseiaceae bacterium]|nr:hypothetical protein [Woeseiaceae bacterium]